MAEEAKTYVFGNDSSANSMLPLMANGGFGGLGGWGGLLLGWLFGMGWGGYGGFGGWGGNNGAGDATRDLVMQGLAGNRESIAAIASTLNTDFNSIQSALCAINTGLANVGAQVGMSGLQVVNAIQAGDASLSRQVCESICGVNSNITNQGYEARIATIEQTNQLGSQADRNVRSITDAIAAQTTLITKEFCELKERELQDKIDSLTAANTTLKGQIDNATQTAAIESYVASLVNPVISDVRAIKASQPATVTVQYPQLSAVPTAQLYGYSTYGYAGNGYWY
jgi:hypothetical protein